MFRLEERQAEGYVHLLAFSTCTKITDLFHVLSGVGMFVYEKNIPFLSLKISLTILHMAHGHNLTDTRRTKAQRFLGAAAKGAA